jgi:hypothetical protein
MDNTLPAFIDYFRQLATAHAQLKGSFIHGAAGRIIAGSRSENTYPLLWLETPTLALSDKDGTAPFGKRTSAVVILQSVAKDDYAEQDAGWASTEAIALDILSHLRRETQARRLSLDSLDGTLLEAVATLSVANEIGWRFEFTLGDYVPLTYDATRWTL